MNRDAFFNVFNLLLEKLVEDFSKNLFMIYILLTLVYDIVSYALSHGSLHFGLYGS